MLGEEHQDGASFHLIRCQHSHIFQATYNTETICSRDGYVFKFYQGKGNIRREDVESRSYIHMISTFICLILHCFLFISRISFCSSYNLWIIFQKVHSYYLDTRENFYYSMKNFSNLMSPSSEVFSLLPCLPASIVSKRYWNQILPVSCLNLYKHLLKKTKHLIPDSKQIPSLPFVVISYWYVQVLFSEQRDMFC